MLRTASRALDSNRSLRQKSTSKAGTSVPIARQLGRKKSKREDEDFLPRFEAQISAFDPQPTKTAYYLSFSKLWFVLPLHAPTDRSLAVARQRTLQPPNRLIRVYAPTEPLQAHKYENKKQENRKRSQQHPPRRVGKNKAGHDSAVRQQQHNVANDFVEMLKYDPSFGHTIMIADPFPGRS